MKLPLLFQLSEATPLLSQLSEATPLLSQLYFIALTITISVLCPLMPNIDKPVIRENRACSDSAESWFLNFRFKYLREFETIFKIILA